LALSRSVASRTTTIREGSRYASGRITTAYTAANVSPTAAMAIASVRAATIGCQGRRTIARTARRTSNGISEINQHLGGPGGRSDLAKPIAYRVRPDPSRCNALTHRFVTAEAFRSAA